MKKSFLQPLLLMIFLVIGLLLGALLNRTDGVISSSKKGDYDNKMHDIMQIIGSEYVDKVNTEDLFNKSINDMLHDLDPHSN